VFGVSVLSLYYIVIDPAAYGALAVTLMDALDISAYVAQYSAAVLTGVVG